MSSTELLAALAARDRRRRGAGRRPDPDARAVDPGDPAAAALRAVAPVLARGDLALRRARARPGTGTTSAAASTPARISTRRCTGSPAASAPRRIPTPSRRRSFIAPACVIDCSEEAAADEDFLLEPAHIEAWEARHGRIPAGAWVLMRTDWSQARRPRGVPQRAARTARTSRGRAWPPCASWSRSGTSAAGASRRSAPTPARRSRFEPPFPAHNLLHGAGKFGLASLRNLDQLPPTGALLITPPLKIEKGSGSPLRVLALVAG